MMLRSMVQLYLKTTMEDLKYAAEKRITWTRVPSGSSAGLTFVRLSDGLEIFIVVTTVLSLS